MTDDSRTDRHQDAPIMDHPFTREQTDCPVCHNRKDRGLLTCWTCYRALDLRNGCPPFVAGILDETERQHQTRAQQTRAARVLATDHDPTPAGFALADAIRVAVWGK